MARSNLLLLLPLFAFGCKKAPNQSATATVADAAAQSAERSPDGATDAVMSAVAQTAAAAAPRGDAATDYPITVQLKPDDPCLLHCRNLVKELHCGTADGCYDGCAKLRSATHCAKEVQAFMACFLKQPPVRFVCESHQPVLGDTACGEQQANVSGCLQRTNGQL
jgi:hypothetical protein